MARAFRVLRLVGLLLPVLAVASLLVMSTVLSPADVLAVPSTPAATSQGAPGVSAGPTGTPPTAAHLDPGEKDSASGWWRDAWLPLAILAFAALVIWWLLRFVRTTFDASLAGLLDLARSGKAVQPAFVSSVQQAGTGAAVTSKGPPPDAIVIGGMSPLTVGTPQAFTATAKSGDAIDGAAITWSFTAEGELANAVSIQPTTGASVTITAFRPGTFTLHADHSDKATFLGASLDVPVIVPAPDKKGIAVPFFGHGYGSQVMAIVLMALATILAIRGIFGTGEVAVLFGAIAGYIFGVTRQGGGDAGS